ncbi:hypothetical protein H8K20_12505 [Neobittarella massiliensis]|uniref:Uncharacterized protein n=1 Tax=Neobittarella massiliensis (ex Bilen et al. 2018) TaxID=2041842 RepID=A0A8J6IM66_9FIRM|nr:hypothetical protein [Neobittarella massiliensis]MBC3517211.1 hypothetical protein [Neobittarella massiliensis]
MKIPFNEEQLVFLKSVPLPFDPSTDLTDEQIEKMVNILEDHIAYHGMNEEGTGENEIGTHCADLLTFLAPYA